MFFLLFAFLTVGTRCGEIALLHQSGRVSIALTEVAGDGPCCRCALALLSHMIVFYMLLVHGKYLSKVICNLWCWRVWKYDDLVTLIYDRAFWCSSITVNTPFLQLGWGLLAKAWLTRYLYGQLINRFKAMISSAVLAVQTPPLLVATEVVIICNKWQFSADPWYTWLLL